MLCFAACVPHPLIAIPEIGKTNVTKVRHTVRAFTVLAQELYAVKPDTIVVLSPHATVVEGTFAINQRAKFLVDFSKFGDLTDRFELTNDMAFGYSLKESSETDVPIILSEDETLDYGTAVPLFFLTKHLHRESLRVVSIGVSSMSLQEHFSFGSMLNDYIGIQTKRIAVIASGDLSHGSSKNSVVPYNPKAFAFNKAVKTALETKNVRGLLDIQTQQFEGVSECGLRPMVTLMGVLGERAYQPEVLSYESVLGVGYLTAHFHIS